MIEKLVHICFVGLSLLCIYHLTMYDGWYVLGSPFDSLIVPLDVHFVELFKKFSYLLLPNVHFHHLFWRVET